MNNKKVLNLNELELTPLTNQQLKKVAGGDGDSIGVLDTVDT